MKNLYRPTGLKLFSLLVVIAAVLSTAWAAMRFDALTLTGQGGDPRKQALTVKGLSTFANQLYVTKTGAHALKVTGGSTLASISCTGAADITGALGTGTSNNKFTVTTAGAGNFASTLNSAGAFTVNTDKLTIAAATGNITGPTSSTWLIDSANDNAASLIGIGVTNAREVQVGRSGYPVYIGGTGASLTAPISVTSTAIAINLPVMFKKLLAGDIAAASHPDENSITIGKFNVLATGAITVKTVLPVQGNQMWVYKADAGAATFEAISGVTLVDAGGAATANTGTAVSGTETHKLFWFICPTNGTWLIIPHRGTIATRT